MLNKSGLDLTVINQPCMMFQNPTGGSQHGQSKHLQHRRPSLDDHCMFNNAIRKNPLKLRSNNPLTNLCLLSEHMFLLICKRPA